MCSLIFFKIKNVYEVKEIEIELLKAIILLVYCNFYFIMN